MERLQNNSYEQFTFCKGSLLLFHKFDKHQFWYFLDFFSFLLYLIVGEGGKEAESNNMGGSRGGWIMKILQTMRGGIFRFLTYVC